MIPATPANRERVERVQTVAPRALKLTDSALGARRRGTVLRRYSLGLNKERPDGLHVLGSPLLNNNQKRIADFALKNRFPSVYQNREAVDAGGLMSYSADLADSNRRVATYVPQNPEGSKARRSAGGAADEA